MTNSKNYSHEGNQRIGIPNNKSIGEDLIRFHLKSHY